MPTSVSSSPVASAVQNALSLFLNEDDVGCGDNGPLSPCQVFSYRDDFNYLWGIRDRSGDSLVRDARSLDRESSVVLVYDGIPDSSENLIGPHINVRDRVTAYDWAVHFFLSVIGEDVAPAIRLFILDTTPQSPNGSFAVQRFPSLLPFMPWVRVYRPFDDLTDIQARSGIFGMGFPKMAAGLVGSEVPSFRGTDESMRGTATRLVREAWVNNLTQPRGRHDVSNLVAPLILAEGLGREENVVGGDPRRAALTKLLRTLGVIESEEEPGNGVSSPLAAPLVESNVFGQFDRVRFLLLDDQAELGYHDVLASLLFGDGAVHEKAGRDGEFVSTSPDGRYSLRSIVEPAPLVESLFETARLSTNSDEDVKWSQPRVLEALDVTGGDSENVEFDVLLLDLRLFGDTETAGASENAFLTRLIEFYERSAAENLDDDHLELAVEAARTRLERGSGGNDVEGLMHLALFPLLLSYVDPSLPIVLFSSTRQQAVIDAVAHRPGVITSFRKPVVSGYTEEMFPRDHMESLSEALEEAVRLHEMRCVWKRIVGLNWGAPPAFRTTGQEKVAVIEESPTFREEWSVEDNTTVEVTVRIRSSNNEEAEDSDSTTQTWIPLDESNLGWDEGAWALDVFNARQDFPDFDRRGYPQRDAGEKQARIRGDTLRSRLSEYYVHYLMQARYFDFTYVPYRFLEECLIPDRLLSSPWITKLNFELSEELDTRNYISSALRLIRNRAAHGYAKPLSGSLEEYRLSSILSFLVLIDFISRSNSDTSILDVEVDDVREFLRKRYNHIYELKGELEAWGVVSDERIEWLDSVLFIFLDRIKKSSLDNSLMVSEVVSLCLQNLYKVRLSNLGVVTASLPGKLHISDKNEGYIVARKDHCYTSIEKISKGDKVRFIDDRNSEGQRTAQDVRKIG